MYLRFRLLYHRDKGIRNASRILSRNFRSGLEAIGKRLATSSRSIMRRDTGEEQRSLKRVVSGKELSLNVIVYSTLLQAFVDAYGLKRGIFPDTRPNSALFKWALRKVYKIKGENRFGLRKAGTKKGSKKVRFPAEEVRTYKRNKRIKKVQTVSRVRKTNKVFIPRNRRERARNRNAKRLAFLVARHIFRNGIKGTKWNARALEANKRVIVNEMKNALQRSANEMKRTA